MLKRRIKEKMQSEQGTSIFFGLLLFLTASILSVVILEGAVTTVKTVASDRTSEQNQLACTSAAQLLRDSIVNVKLSADIVETKTGDHVETAKNWKDVSNASLISTSLATSQSFAQMLQNYVKEADKKNKDVFGTDYFGIPVTKKLIISSAGSGTDAAFSQFSNLDKINAEFTITPRKSDDTAKKNEVTYDIVVKLSTGTGRDSSHVVLSLTGKTEARDATSSVNGNTSTTTIPYEYKWEAKDIFYGDSVRTLGDSQ